MLTMRMLRVPSMKVVPLLNRDCKIYASPFTMQLVKRRMEEYNLWDEKRFETIDIGDKFMAGPWEIETLRVTHSIPDCLGLVFRCEDGTILHTGDWKIDEQPVDGEIFDRAVWEKLGAEGVDLMMSDSTNVLSPGRTISEQVVRENLARRALEFNDSPRRGHGEQRMDKMLRVTASQGRGRIIATSFASNLHRIGALHQAAKATNRKLCFMGRSLHTYLAAAFESGDAPFNPAELIDAADLVNYAPHEQFIVTTGSQAEPRAALNLAAMGASRMLNLEPSDLILYSAKQIPGNEKRIQKMMNQIAMRGSEIAMGRGEMLHTSGHAQQEELSEVLKLVRPKHFLPVHGEYAFLKAHEALARSLGVHHTTVVHNGQMVGVRPTRSHVEGGNANGLSVVARHNLRMIYNDGSKYVGTEEDMAIKERVRLSINGIIIASVQVLREEAEWARQEELYAGCSGSVRVTSRMLFLNNGNTLAMLQKAGMRALASCPLDADLGMIEKRVGDAISRTVQRALSKRPDVVVVAHEAPETAALAPIPKPKKGVDDVGFNRSRERERQGPGETWTAIDSPPAIAATTGQSGESISTWEASPPVELKTCTF
eukprot:scaffold1628_cov407-Prasinococcus_capsulatus_cf.AAC.4